MKKKLKAQLAKLKALDVSNMSAGEQQRHRSRITELETKLAWLRKCDEMAKKLNTDREIHEQSIETTFFPKPSLN